MASAYPKGSTNANWFSAFNAVAFQIVMGAPIFLYAKSLGASATVLGVIAAMPSLLNVAQIPAAYHLARVGYRRLILLGWGMRCFFIFLIALVPLCGFLTPLSQMALILLSLFIFNLLRGIAAGAWLPWLTELIPEDIRGRFLSRDQVFLHAGSLLAFVCSAVLLQGQAHPWQFGSIFLVSALAAAASLLFLRKVPDVDARDTATGSNTPVPWLAIVTFPPFLRLVVFTVVYTFGIGAASVFGVAFMKSQLGYTESQVMLFGTGYFVGAILSLPFVGRILDRAGSRRLIFLAVAVFLIIFGCWSLVAIGLLKASFGLILALHFFSGVAGANLNLAHVRLLMKIMPPMGRSHFFAFFSVISSIVLGMTPLLWGIVIDAVGAHERAVGVIFWNQYSVFYVGSLLWLAASWVCSLYLSEKAHAGHGHGQFAP